MKKTKINNNLYYVIFAMLGLGFIVWSMLYQSGIIGGPVKVKPGEKSLSDKTEIVWTELKEEAVPQIYTAIGTVRSRESIDIISRLPAARILDIKVRSGDAVKSGEMLVKLEDTDLKAALDTAQENLNAALSRYDLAENEFNRSKDLLKNNTISQSEYDQSLSNYNSARADVLVHKHVMENAKANFSYSELRAPFDGIVAERFNDPGDLATPQNRILAFFDPGKLELRIPIREGLVSKLKVGEKLNVKIEALNRSLAAEIKEIIPSVDPGSRTFSINACLLGDTAGIMPGMFAICQVEIGTENILPIAATSVRHVGQLEYLIVKTSSGAVEQFITTSPLRNGMLKIVSGAQAGIFYKQTP
ncbi:MAG: efflux RND transporter periplasmic adaptor subunit [Thermoguttaceae bacterium]